MNVTGGGLGAGRGGAWMIDGAPGRVMGPEVYMGTRDATCCILILAPPLTSFAFLSSFTLFLFLYLLYVTLSSSFMHRSLISSIVFFILHCTPFASFLLSSYLISFSLICLLSYFSLFPLHLFSSTLSSFFTIFCFSYPFH